MGRRPIAILHNRYQHAGGEDAVFAGESAMLSQFGHPLVRYTLDNSAITGMRRLAVASATLWNEAVRKELRTLFDERHPAVAHFHNTFPLMSPAAYYAARDAGVPVVQTLHNYRLICPGATLFRDGRACEECLPTRTRWPGVVHGCYRGSRSSTAAVAAMVTLHRSLGTWSGAVAVYVALSEFSRSRFIAGGLPAGQIVVKPNFLARDPGVGAHSGGYVLFVGRLSPEKGLDTLLDAWRRLPAGLTLKIAGDGPLRTRAATTGTGVEWLGAVPHDRIIDLMREAAVLVVPSTCYENFPMSIVEAFATALPVIVSGHGALAEIVTDGEDGWHFLPGDAVGLADTLAATLARPQMLRRIGRAGRAQFEARYTAARNHRALMEIYDRATDQQRAA